MSNLSEFFGNAAGSSDLVAGYIRNLHIECSSATQVVIKSGSKAGADDGSMVITAPSDITVDITNSGANGLDTGSEASDTWYYIYMIYNTTSATVAGLLSASSSSPTLPSGYTKKRLVGAVRNNGSSNLRQFVQRGCRVIASGVSILAGGTATSWTALSLTAAIPVTLTVEIRIQGRVYIAQGASQRILTMQTRQSGAPYAYTIVYRSTTTTANGAQMDYELCDVVVDGSSTIDYRHTFTPDSGSYGDITIHGYNIDL